MSEYLIGEPLVEVRRGERVESVHHVAACACDHNGTILYEAGNIEAPVFLRSTAKPFIAAAAIKRGVAVRFGLSQQEIALMAASHTGEDFHAEAARSILRKIGLYESALQCGAHEPYNHAAAEKLRIERKKPSAVHNNCSGKHAGILALCTVLGTDCKTYMEVSNPAQEEILAFCARMTGEHVADMPLGIDGCGIPVFATPLSRAALAFARFATLQGIDDTDAAALKIVRDAMIAHPRYVSGTGEFDSVLMEHAAGAIACKGGAEGVHGDALIEPGVGYAQKVLDGSKRAVAPAVLSAISGLHPSMDLRGLASFARPALYNRAGRVVGEVIAKRAHFVVKRT